MRSVRIGTRGSALAVWQANFVRDWLDRTHGAPAELVVIKTSGDRFPQAPVGQMGLKGVFIKELEDALAEKRVDLAVHSMKDVPTQVPAGLAFPAIAKREEVRDSLVSRGGETLDELKRGARVGTSSLRRRSQLLHYRPDLELCELRGNVDTRLRKLERGDYDAIVLAKAGLDRLGWSDKITQVLPTEISLPAVGQGALGVEARAGDREVIELIAGLDDPETRTGIRAERALLAELEGGCQVPLGAWGRLEGGELVIEACVLSADGAEWVRKRIAAAPGNPEAAGKELARMLLEAGADRLLKLAGRTIGSR